MQNDERGSKSPADSPPTDRSPAGKPPASKQKGRSYSLRAVLALVFGTLVALAVGLVLIMSVSANFRNTFSLLNDQAVGMLDGMEREIFSEIKPVVDSVDAIAELYGRSEFELGETDQTDHLLSALLSTHNGAEAYFLIDLAGNSEGMLRPPRQEPQHAPPSFLDAQAIATISANARRKPGEPNWGTPIEIDGIPYHNVAHTLERDGRIVGYAVALVGGYTINRIVVGLGKSNETTAFVLAGEDTIIAHSGQPEFFKQHRHASIADFPDEAIRQFTTAELSEEFGKAADSGVDIRETEGSDGIVFISKPLQSYGPVPYTLGAYFDKADIGEEVFRAFASLIAGLAGLFLAVIAAVLIGKRISQPMTQIAQTASKFSDFRIDEITPLPASRIREINDQALALNKLHIAMNEFSRYVPRSVVGGLIASGSEAALPRKRNITVLFTDIVDFTTLSERLDAHETAQLLSEHFDVIGAQIENRNGTVDKFMGDGLMAFWGAPEENPNHVVDAIDAAKGISEALKQQNAKRRAKGLSNLRMRVGLHTGPAVVGNIGGATRQNYTIVGDTVNVAQRLEQLGKEMLQADDDFVAVVSGKVAELAEDHAQFIPAGTRVIRGRERPMPVCRLVVDDARAAGETVIAFPGASSA